MTDHPILFNAPMVRAILSGTKTQTRRIVKPHLIGESRHPPYDPVLWVHEDYSVPLDSPDALSACPFGQPGDRLWVRETFHACPHCMDGFIAYKAGGFKQSSGDIDHTCMEPLKPVCRMHGWKPSTHMPRWASRITLEVTSVRVERLNDISEDDAKNEGITDQLIPKPWGFDTGWCADWSRVGTANKYSHDGKTLAAADICLSSPKMAFANLWESINGLGSWAANPWVWVVEFRRVEG